MTSCKYIVEFVNPYFKCVQNHLVSLVGYDNDISVINAQVRALQRKYDAELETIETRCAKLRKSVMDRNHDQNEFTQHIRNIDEIRELYAGRIEDLVKNKEKQYADAKECFFQYITQKYQYFQFHEKTMNYLKCLATKSTDPKVVLDIDSKINIMNKRQLQDIEFIKQTEHEVEPFLHEMKNVQETFDECFFRDYDFLPQGKNFDGIQALADEMKITNLPAVRKALAQAHVYQATDIKSFVAAYLLHMEKCELAAKQKLNELGDDKD